MSEVIEAEKLKQIINKIETIEQERLESADILKESFNEAKSMGFDVKIIKHITTHKKPTSHNKLKPAKSDGKGLQIFKIVMFILSC